VKQHRERWRVTLAVVANPVNWGRLDWNQMES
jgi:hypothetical protein